MPSEKLRYLKLRSGPTPPLAFDTLKDKLQFLDPARLAQVLWERSANDDILRKIVVVSVTLAKDIEIEKARAAIDYAMHFPDYIRYFEGGHGQILNEITFAVRRLISTGQENLAEELAVYAIGRAEEISENFL